MKLLLAVAVSLVMSSAAMADSCTSPAPNTLTFNGSCSWVSGQITLGVNVSLINGNTKQLWQYTITNNSWNPPVTLNDGNPWGDNNGISGFDLRFNVSTPATDATFQSQVLENTSIQDYWADDQDNSGVLPGYHLEFDLGNPTGGFGGPLDPNTAQPVNGNGITPGYWEMFSFTTDVRTISFQDGSSSNDTHVHTWRSFCIDPTDPTSCQQTQDNTVQGAILVPGDKFTGTIPTNSVPEPASLALVGSGLAMLWRRRKR